MYQKESSYIINTPAAISRIPESCRYVYVSPKYMPVNTPDIVVKAFQPAFTIPRLFFIIAA